MNRSFFLFLTAFLTLVAACKKDDPQENCPQTDFSELQVAKLSDSAFTTSRISMLMKVDDRQGIGVSGLTAENFAVWERKNGETCYDEINPFEADRRIVDNPQRFRHSTLLVLDLSKSITQNALADLKMAARSFVENVLPDTAAAYQMAIYWFDGSQQLFQLVPFTSNKTTLTSAISGITSTLCQDCNSTNLFGSVVNAADEAVERYNQLKVDGVLSGSAVVIFTDGDDEAGWKTLAEANTAISQAQQASGQTINFFTVGLGTETNLQNLKELGKDGFAFATDKTQLEGIFVQTADKVRREANSFYLVEYCSPKRAGNVDVKVVVKSGNDRGTLTTAFDAGKFMAPYSCQ
jgi:uncharacterized protein YegL